MRTDFFAETALHNRRGYRALMQSRIPFAEMKKGAPWHADISPFLQRSNSDIQSEAEETFSSLRCYTLDSEHDRPAESLRRESEACEQLTLDLALSTDIYAPHKFNSMTRQDNLDVAMETMSRATEAMSLQEDAVREDACPIPLSFLRPAPVDHYTKTKSTASTDSELKGLKEDPLSSAGIKLLLSEWELGSDPYSYVYNDPYDVDQISKNNLRLTPGQFRQPTRSQTDAVGSQRPPMVVQSTPKASQAPPVITASQPSVFKKSIMSSMSQEIGAPTSQRNLLGLSQSAASKGHLPSSQGMMASTQVLPGPHGGREALIKKTTTKRMGGF